MSTVRDVIYDAMLLLGVMESGEAIPANQAQDAFRRFNGLLSIWSAEELLIYTTNRNVYPLVIGQASYTYGPSGNFNAARPIWIDRASVIPAANPTLEIPVDIYTDQDWQTVSIKSTTSSFPLCIHPRGDYPQNTIDVWPVPTATCSLVFYVPVALTAATSINDTVSFPPGYEEAFTAALAVRLGPIFGVQASPDVRAMAISGKDTLRAQNLVVPTLLCDSSMLGDQNGPSVEAIRSKGYVCD